MLCYTMYDSFTELSQDEGISWWEKVACYMAAIYLAISACYHAIHGGSLTEVGQNKAA